MPGDEQCDGVPRREASRLWPSGMADREARDARLLSDFAPRVQRRLLLARWLYRTGRLSDWGLEMPPPLPEGFAAHE
jgi:hypothetical protein